MSLLRTTIVKRTHPLKDQLHATDRAMPSNAVRAGRRQQRYMDSSFVACENHADLTHLYAKVCHLQTSLEGLQRQISSLILLQEQQLCMATGAHTSGVGESAD